MHKLIDYICDELYVLEDKIAREGDLTKGEIEYGDILAHFGKNLMKMEDHRNSSRSGSYDDGNSYRGRRNARRDSMGRYSKDGYSRAAAEDMANTLKAMMKDAPDDNIKRDMERLVERMEQMQ